MEGDDSFNNAERIDSFPSGVHAGYNHMFDQFLLGVGVHANQLEADTTSVNIVVTDVDWGIRSGSCRFRS